MKDTSSVVKANAMTTKTAFDGGSGTYLACNGGAITANRQRGECRMINRLLVDGYRGSFYLSLCWAKAGQLLR